jgi:hypothetical protein
MVAGEPGGDDRAMNLLLSVAILFAVPAVLGLAIRRLGGSDGIGLIELVGAAVAPFIERAPSARAVPEPEFEPWRFDRPLARPSATPSADALERPERLPTAA